MTIIEQARKEFDKFLISKEFNLSDDEVIKKAKETESIFKISDN